MDTFPITLHCLHQTSKMVVGWMKEVHCKVASWHLLQNTCVKLRLQRKKIGTKPLCKIMYCNVSSVPTVSDIQL